MNDHSISVDQARYATSIVDKYLDTATFKTNKKLYKVTFPYYMIFTKYYASTSDEQMENFTREFNINYRACIVSLIYMFSTRVYFSFAVHKLARFSSNTGKLDFERLVHLLRYIRDNMTLGLKYYTDMKYASLSHLLRQSNI